MTVLHFSACENGTYGQDCTNQCSNCRNNLCYHTNGTCFQCVVGYQGENCSDGISIFLAVTIVYTVTGIYLKFKRSVINMLLIILGIHFLLRKTSPL